MCLDETKVNINKKIEPDVIMLMAREIVHIDKRQEYK